MARLLQLRDFHFFVWIPSWVVHPRGSSGTRYQSRPHRLTGSQRRQRSLSCRRLAEHDFTPARQFHLELIWREDVGTPQIRSEGYTSPIGLPAPPAARSGLSRKRLRYDHVTTYRPLLIICIENYYTSVCLIQLSRFRVCHSPTLPAHLVLGWAWLLLDSHRAGGPASSPDHCRSRLGRFSTI